MIGLLQLLRIILPIFRILLVLLAIVTLGGGLGHRELHRSGASCSW
jgi:hypothetical protein